MMTKGKKLTYWVCRYCGFRCTTDRGVQRIKCKCRKNMYHSDVSYLGAMLKWQKKPRKK